MGNNSSLQQMTPDTVDQLKIRSQDDYNSMLAKLKTEFDARYESNVPSANPNMNEYRKISTIGKGAFGTVVLYQQKSTKEYMVFKVLLKKTIIDKHQMTQALHEKRVLNAISHPFVINLLKCFKDNDAVYFVMPFIEGGDMFAYLERLHKMDEGVACFFAAQVLLAIEYLHAMQIVHRDIKPENVLICNNGYIKLGDLGLSKRIETRVWSFCGTPEYIAPEVITSKGYGKAVDFWAFGVLVYELVSGRLPFEKDKDKRMGLYERIIEGTFAIPSTFSDGLKHLVHNLIEVDTTRRFGNLKNGINDIKLHKWFKSINWIKLLNQEMKTPFKPVFKPSDHVASNFDKYQDLDYAQSTTCLYEMEFIDI